MKKQSSLLIIIFALLFPILGFSYGDDLLHSKQKNIKKTYIVNSDAGVNIDNSYGNIFVTTWNEDKIELDIWIKVSGDSENWVNKRINAIDVDITPLKSLVSAKTIIENSGYKIKGNNNSFEINYTIKIPKNGSVKLNNKYGNIITTDLFSSTDIYCKYGKVTLGKLNSAKNSIQIEYCSNSSIDFLKNGSVTAKYSGLKIDETAKLDLISDYTDVEIRESNDVKYNGKYGNIKIQSIKSLEANGNYLTLKIGEVFNQLKLDAGYSNVSIGAVNAKANSIAIVASYTGISIGYQPNCTFDFDVAVRYANFKFDNDLEFNTKEETNNSKKYSGYYRKKGVNNLSIISDYGNVILKKKQ